MKILVCTLGLLFLISGLEAVEQNLSNGEPDAQQNAYHVYIGFKADQPIASCSKIISRFSGTIVERLREFSYPVFLVKIENSYNSSHFQNRVVPKIEQDKRIHFVSMQREDMNNLPLMEIASSSIQRHGDISIQAPKKKHYDFTRNTADRNNYHSVLRKHIPGLKSQVGHRVPTRPNLYATFELDLNKEGEVEQVRMLSNNIRNPEIRKRLKEKIYTWRDFPRRTNNDLVTLRFKFRTQ